MQKDENTFQGVCSRYRPFLPTTMRHCSTHGLTPHEIRTSSNLVSYTCVRCYDQMIMDLLID
jgi:hypothetical protein